MVRTQVQLTEDQHRRLKEAARTRDVSLAEVVRRSVDAWLAEQGRDGSRELVERALSVVGRFASGLTDVAERHDEYLAEDFGS